MRGGRGRAEPGRSVCRLALGQEVHGALWGLEGRLEGAEMTLVTVAFSCLCPAGALGVLWLGSAAPTASPFHEASLQTGGLRAALAFSLQKVFRVESRSAGPPSAGTQPPSSDQTPREGGGGGLPHSCLWGCRAASTAPLCLEFLPLNLSFYGKCPPAPCSPVVGNRIISSQKTR